MHWFELTWFESSLMLFKSTWFKTTELFCPIFPTSKLFSHLAFFLDMPWRALVVEIWRPSVKEVKATNFIGGLLSPIFRPNLIIRISVPLFRLVICGFMLLVVLDGFTPIPSFFLTQNITYFISNLPNTKEDDPITVSPSINESARLVIMNERVIWTHSTYREFFRLYIYTQQHGMFHPSVVGVCWLIHTQLLRNIFPKNSGKWWYWYISDVGFVRFAKVRLKSINFISYNFLLFNCTFSIWLFMVS